MSRAIVGPLGFALFKHTDKKTNLISVVYLSLDHSKRKNQTFLCQLCRDDSDARCGEEHACQIPGDWLSRPSCDSIFNVYVPRLPVRKWT